MGSAVTWNLPNVLTVARLVCVPILAWLLALDESWARDTAAIVFVAAAVTDSTEPSHAAAASPHASVHSPTQ